jgi:heterodisulfide reductase subunit A-like polyferredoxin
MKGTRKQHSAAFKAQVALAPLKGGRNVNDLVHLANARIVVIGEGPAGGALSLELAQASCDVVLLVKQPVSGWKIGETLPRGQWLTGFSFVQN